MLAAFQRHIDAQSRIQRATGGAEGIRPTRNPAGGWNLPYPGRTVDDFTFELIATAGMALVIEATEVQAIPTGTRPADVVARLIEALDAAIPLLWDDGHTDLLDAALAAVADAKGIDWEGGEA